MNKNSNAYASAPSSDYTNTPTPTRSSRRLNSPGPRSSLAPPPPTATMPAPAATSAGAVPIPSSVRPALPTKHVNQQLKTDGFKNKHAVKYQDLHLDSGEKIVIARVKLPTPKGVSGHIIKRYDTNAISASAFYRVAFPTSSIEEELAEMNYLTKIYDTKTAGREDGTGIGKLTGTWVPASCGRELANYYGLESAAEELINFPPPSNYTPLAAEKGKKTTTTTTTTTTAIAVGTDVPDSSKLAPNEEKPRSTKRRRAQSPLSQSQAVESPSLASAVTPSSTGAVANGVPTSVHVTQEIVTDPSTGMSHETTRVTVDVSPGKEKKSAANGVVVPSTSGAEVGTVAAAGEVVEKTEDEITEAIEKAKELVESLKAQEVLKTLDADETMSRVEEQELTKKRGREDDEEAEEGDEVGGQKGGVLSRFFWGKKRRGPVDSSVREALEERRAREIVPLGTAVAARRIQPETRKAVAIAGVVGMGALALAVPYIFGV